jgi:heptosyltransferase-2/heptosyltransferase-3
VNALRDRLRRVALSLVATALPAAPPAPRAPSRLLLIRPDHLGDVLLTSPAVALLRAALPKARLTFMVGPWSEEVARRGAEVDEILTCEFPGFTRRAKRSLIEPYGLLVREASRIRGRYDLAIVLRPDHWWGALLAALAGVPVRLGWATPTTRSLLNEALPLPPGRHAVELNLALIQRAVDRIGEASRVVPPAAPGDRRPIFRLTDEERAWAAEIAGESDRPLVLIHAGSGSPLKNWPPERWAQVGDALAKADARVALSGGQDDLAGPTAIEAAMKEPCLQLTGATSLGQLAALAERSALAIGTDNGPLHLAAALGTPTVRLYGPTDEAVFGPWGAEAEHTALINPLPCRPCGNLLEPPCGASREPPCLLGLEVERVVEAALAHLSNGSLLSQAPA